MGLLHLLPKVENGACFLVHATGSRRNIRTAQRMKTARWLMLPKQLPMLLLTLRRVSTARVSDGTVTS